MSATRRLFTYKCRKGHVSEQQFPLGTRLDDHDEIACSQCIVKSDALEPAYLVATQVVSAEEGRKIGRRS
jgi:hypothetical protein